MAKTKENIILVLQGGGALGAYQAGAFEGLLQHDLTPDWVAGISIGAINAALICGNKPDQRLRALKGFWERITSLLSATLWFDTGAARSLYSEAAAAAVMAAGAPGFFKPRMGSCLLPFGAHQAVSVYDTEPLRRTLTEFVDFDYLNDHGPRLSMGAVDIETANFAYFDSAEMRIGPEHIMASGALPPGFPPVEIDGRMYWDGGLVSNTPLQYIMVNLGQEPALIFQVDLFSARGAPPVTMAAVSQREKDIRYSSRTRLTTDRYLQLHAIRAAAARLAAMLPEDMQNNPDLKLLQETGPSCPITLVELIHRKQTFEGVSKDYEFSRLSMIQHWSEGLADVQHALNHGDWRKRNVGFDGLQVFDFGNPEVPVQRNAI